MPFDLGCDAEVLCDTTAIEGRERSRCINLVLSRARPRLARVCNRRLGAHFDSLRTGAASSHCCKDAGPPTQRASVDCRPFSGESLA